VRRITVVLTDGLRPDAITAGDMPSLSALARDYTRVANARTVRPSATVAALASLATGVGPETHGLIEPGLGFLTRIGRLRPLARELSRHRMLTAVVTTEIATTARPIAAALTSAAGIGRLVGHGDRARDTALAARDVLAELEAGLLFVYLPDCDRAGHAHGWMSAPYFAAAAELDVAIGILAECASDAPLIVVADHGGGGVRPREHDDPHPVNDWIPMVFAGDAVERRRVVGGPVSLLDLPPTILWWLGVPIPASYEGRVLVEAFGQPAPAEEVVA
jgi:predicted AlkP superfamily pyrophosphatase or phosphodiesterase